MRKDERHQIKRDELLTAIERATLYLAHNTRRVAAMAGAAAVLVMAAFGLSAWLGAREERASALLGEVIRTYRAPVVASLDALQQAPAGVQSYTSAEERDGKVLQLAEEILSRYGSSKAAPKAFYYQALAQAALKKEEDAVKTLEALLRQHPGDFLAPLARFQLARLKETRGNPSEALVQFQVLADDTRGLFPREEGLLGVARCQERLGHAQEALKAYRRILSDFPDSDYRGEASRKVQELS